MKSYYKFINHLEKKYSDLNLTSAALLYEQTYDSIILNNLYEITSNRKKLKTTQLTLQEIRNYFLETNYCFLIYKANLNFFHDTLCSLNVAVKDKPITLYEANSIYSLLPYCGLNSINLATNLDMFINNIKPYYYQAISSLL